MMAWGYFTRPCDYRRPKSKFSFTVKPSSRAQQVPRDLLDYAIARGEATEAPTPPKSEAPSSAGVTKRARTGRKPGR